MSKKALITGTLILTAANIITKLMGFFYRIFMVNAIGNEGMGLYQLIMPIYMLTWSITSSGFTTTISKLTAQEKARGQYGNMGRVLKQSIFMSFSISVCISIVLFFGADFIAQEIVKEARTAISLRLLSLAIPFMSCGSCIRGYFLGLQNTVIPALSQILEQCVRIGIIFIIAAYFVPYGLAYACAAAVLGIVFGEILSFLFVFTGYLRFKRKKRYIQKPSLSSRRTCTMILSMALPLTASRITGSLLSTTENILIPQRLQLYGQSSSIAMSNYGQLTGMAMPLLMLPSAFLMAVSVSLVPEISEASAIRQTEKISRTVTVALLFTSIISIGVGAAFAVFPYEIGYIVYGQNDIGGLLFSLSFLCPFLYMQTTFNGLLNGLGEHFFIFANNVISSIITIGFIYFLMPLYGIDAFLWGWFISLIITTVLNVHRIKQRTGIHIHFFNSVVKPFMAGMASGLTVRYLIQISEPSKLFFLLAITCMFIMYFLFLLALGCLSKENFSLLYEAKKSKM